MADVSARRALVRAGSILVAAAALVAGWAGPASAHAELVASDPPSGAVSERPPVRVVLRFSEAVEVGLGAVRLYGADGRRIDIGGVRHGRSGSEVVIGLPRLGPGGYVVTWRVVSADSHPVRGALTFRVGETADGRGLAALSRRLLAAQGGDAGTGGALAAVRGAGVAAVVLCLGGLAFVTAIWPAGLRSRRARRMIGGAWVVAVLATAAGVALQGAHAGGFGLGGALRRSVVEATFATRFGRASLVRLGMLGTLAVAVVAGRSPTRRRWVAVAAAVAGVAVLATFGVAGHPGSDHPAAAWVALDTVHLAAVCVWLGGLIVLAAAALPESGVESAGLAQRFSRVAFAAVVALVLTGSLQGWRQVRESAALTGTSYGRLLVVKVGLVALMLGAAAVSRSWVRARVAGARAVTAGPGALAAAGGTARLRRAVTAEAALGLAVVAVTAVLAGTVPGRLAVARPLTTEVRAGPVMAEVTLDPAKAGPLAVHVYTLTPEGAPRDVPELTARLSLPSEGIGPLDVPLRRAGPGHFAAYGVDVPIQGLWILEVAVRTSDVDLYRGTAQVRIR